VISESSPTARALLTLELLQGQPGITADRIAERLEVTARAARRYVAILREAGIPIVSVSGPGGGYRLGRGLRLPPLQFSPAEALGLVMAVLDGHHRAADPTDPVGSALGRILRALPEDVAAQAEAVRRAAAPAADHGAARPDPATTATLVSACAEHRRVLVRYRAESGKELTIEAEPWAIVVRHSRWYLLCWSLPAAAVRAYRVDRVQEVDVLQETFAPPADLDPVGHLEDHLGIGWEYPAEIVIHAPLQRCFSLLPRGLGRLEELDPERTRLLGSTGNPFWYAERLARIPVSYQILGGAEVTQAAQVLARRMLAAAGADDQGDLRPRAAGRRRSPGNSG
jgi:predicted DNA-binding transcriptional regulator YafY